MQILCLDFLLSQDLNTIKVPQLGDVEQNLQTVEFTVLDRVARQV